MYALGRRRKELQCRQSGGAHLGLSSRLEDIL
jgi:hypothetical protein